MKKEGAISKVAKSLKPHKIPTEFYSLKKVMDIIIDAIILILYGRT